MGVDRHMCRKKIVRTSVIRNRSVGEVAKEIVIDLRGVVSIDLKA